MRLLTDAEFVALAGDHFRTEQKLLNLRTRNTQHMHPDARAEHTAAIAIEQARYNKLDARLRDAARDRVASETSS